MKQFDEMAMRNASIFELRNVARDLGVPSPTIYKKEELMTKIMQVVRGEVKPQLPKSRQGRPPLAGNRIISNANTSFLFDDFASENKCEKYNLNGFLDGKRMSLANEGALFGKVDGEFAEGEGFLKFDKNGFGFLFKKGYVASHTEAIHVPNSFIKEHNLREGDFVECTIKNLSTQNARMLTNVENAADFVERKSFCSLKAVKSESKIALTELVNATVDEGSRNVLLVENLKNQKDILSAFKNLPKEYSFLYLLLDALPEDLPLNADSFYTFAGDSEKKNVFTTELFIERVKRLVEKGERVVILVNELMKIVKYQNFSNSHSIFDVKNKSFELCLRLLRLAASYENGGSVTVFALLKNLPGNNCFDCLLGELDNVNAEIFKI